MLLQLAQVNPCASVFEAWRGIEYAAVRVIQAKTLIYGIQRASSGALRPSGVLCVRWLYSRQYHFAHIIGRPFRFSCSRVNVAWRLP
jgi:hypothetical protein